MKAYTTSFTLLFSMTSAEILTANQTFIDSWFEKSRDKTLNKVEQEIAELQQLTRSGPSGQVNSRRLNDFRQLRELKTLVNWLQRDPGFGKYCHYGCYCLDWLHRLEEGNGPPKGKGLPVDSVDAACKIQTECYWCAKNDVEEVHHEAYTGFVCNPDMGYNYRLTYERTDPFNTQLRGIHCTDPWFHGDNGDEMTNCRRTICECDRGLAYRLRDAESDYNVQHHKFDGGFVDSVCVGQPSASYGGRDTCCGHYENEGRRFRYNSMEKMCCGKDVFNEVTHDCCNEETGDVKEIGTC